MLPALEKAERGLNAMTLPDLMEIRYCFLSMHVQIFFGDNI